MKDGRVKSDKGVE